MGGWRNERMRERGSGTGNMGEGGLPRGGAPGSHDAQPIDPPTVALVQVAAALAEGKEPALRQRLVAARAAAVPDIWIEELLLQSLRGLHPALEDLVLVDAYGKVIGRPGLDLKRRELCTVAEIAVLGAADQLHSHLRGALNTGATRAEVEGVLAVIDGDLDAERRRSAHEQWNDVKGRKL